MPPYPYPDDDTILRIASGADDPESDEFVECEKCRARPGMVALCADCLRRRRLFFERKLAKESNPSATDICAKAAELVGGERDRTHGTKRENFRKIAALWNAYLRIRVDSYSNFGGDDLTEVDVGHMMALMKIARTQHGAFNLDDYIDGAGYLGCAGEIAAQLNAEATPSPAAGPPCQKCGKPLDPRRNRWWLGSEPIHYECLNNQTAGVPPDADAAARRS